MSANSIEPGGPDQGQPTHFLPRRNQFVFRIRVPRDFGNRELVWTLTTNGKTEKAYGSLKPDYVVNATVMAANFGAGGQTGTMPDLAGNVAPVLKIEGERTRRVKVGEPVSLIAVATDDGKPRVRQMQHFGHPHGPQFGDRVEARLAEVSRSRRGDFRPAAVQRMGGYA